TETEPILFTANSTTPTAGYWYNIRFEDTTRDALTKLEHCTVEYGGRNTQGNIYITNASPSIRLSTIRNSEQYGIYVYGTGSNGTIIECNNIKDNLVGIHTSSAQPLIGGNNFISNTNYGVYNASSAQVSAINNWWGDAGGPNLSGDKTYGNVNFTPWRTAPSDCVTGVPVNDPPLVPHNPNPANGATGVFFPNGATTLAWTGGDPNPSDTVLYDVLWGTDSASLAPLAEGLTAATVSATGILPNTTYFWQVVARDNFGAQTTGPIWQFTTANPQPDLVVSNVTWTPASGITAGQTVSFTATVQNTGSGPSVPNFAVAFQINSARSTQYVNQQLQVGQSVQVTHQWIAQVGATSVTVESDSTNAIAENNESNNNRTAAVGTIADTTPPELTNTTPNNGVSVQQVNRIDIYLTDRFGGSVDNAATLATMAVTNGGTPVVGTTHVSSNLFYFTPSVIPLAEGNYQVSITAYDTAGNHQAYSFAFTVDNLKPAPPTITGGSVTSGTIQVRPAQNRSNQSTVTFTGTRENNTGIMIGGSIHVSVGSGPWTANRGLGQGANALEIRSRDAAGNVSDPVFVDIEVDSVAPAITTVAPAANVFLNNAPAAVTIAYTETGSGIDATAVTHTIRDGNLNPVAGAWTDSAGLLRFVPTTPFGDSTYTVEARLVDNLGNVSSPLQSVFTVDTTAPPQPVIAPVTSPTHNVTQTISGQKEAFAAILLNGQQIVDQTQGTTWQHTATLASGENAFSFVARDRAGNLSPALSVTIVFDDVPPSPVTTLTASGDGIGTSVFLNWNGYNEAAHGDIQSYRIFYETSPFTNVSALVVKATVNAGAYTHVVQNLTSGTTYWFAVVAVDRMGNFNPAVTAVSATPTDKLAPGDVHHLTVQSFADRLVFSWQAPTSNQSDLAGYRVYFNGGAAELLPAGSTSLERTGLAASAAYAFRITSYDSQNNESIGVVTTGYTWLNNPLGLAAQPYDGYVQLSWAPVTPAAHLKHYAVYVSSSGPFASIQGMTPALVATSPQAKVAGLTNHQAYYFAVTAVNRSDGQRPEVTTVSATPTPDESGPQITAVQIDGQALIGNRTISRNAVLTLTATDPSGVSRIEFKLDGALLFIDYSAPYRWDIDIQKFTDGTHSLEISAYDTLNNTSSASYSLIVALAPPVAPTITQPTDGLLTNQTAIVVQGQAEKESSVILYLESVAAGAPLTVDAEGRFSSTMTLNQGANRIRAAARNRSGTGPMSPEITVTVDTSKPSAPTNVSAQAIEGGVVRLAWGQPSGKLVSAYNIYRSDAPFTAIVAATKVNAEPIKATGYRDLPSTDGTWYYRMTSRDDAQNESDPSAQVSATSDSVLPRISTLQYTPHGNVDPVSGAVAPGLVDVSVTLSETLMAMPFLSITPQAGMPITIALTQTGDTSYSGRFTITADTPSGTAYAVFSGRDRVGNRGTEIDNGLSLLMDTDGPAIRRIVLDPASPIQNSTQTPVTVHVTIGLDEAAADGTAPVLDYRLSGPGRNAVHIPVLTQIAPDAGDAQTWQADFQLPADAGQLQVETLQFMHSTEDNLGNSSDRILSPNHFQVYQGNLPPLEAPSGLTAKALSGGRIDLSWNAVEEAIGYQLYRQAPNQSQLTVLTRLTGQTLVFQDATPMDGTYLYSVSSLRSENGQEAESSPSATVRVEADAQAPAAPQNLTLLLIPLGIEAQWQAVAGETVTYRLYRSDAMQITTVQGLAPIEASFNGTKALDRKPSPTAHTYVVTAVDPSGNESAPSNSVYLNFDLLPADTITVEQADDAKPVLSWTHPGGSLSGFDVYMGPVGQTVKVNTGLVSATQMTDNGFAGEPREYSVIAVDPNDVQSQARTIRLPAIRAERTDDKLLRRGIMNKLEYTVTNLSGQTANDLRLILNLHGSDHPSELFSLAGNQSSVIPVIVAGYGDLPDVAPLAVTVQMTPNPGETARIVRHGEIQVGEGMLALQIYNEELIRGGSGKVWFTLQNTGEADIEIVTALNHGNKASDEAVFTLLDGDDNVLSTLPMQQGLGASVVTLSNGKTVARIAAGAIFESAPVQIPVPAGAPDEMTLRLSIANIYHHCGQDDQLVMRGFASTQAVAIIETDYTGAITGITPPVTSGLQDVQISGRAVLRDTQQSVPNAPLNLIISLNGFERKISLTTDNAGNF
ncbi:MAG: Ig-like domain-containing protein, partial [Desulfatitalea sp.]